MRGDRRRDRRLRRTADLPALRRRDRQARRRRARPDPASPDRHPRTRVGQHVDRLRPRGRPGDRRHQRPRPGTGDRGRNRSLPARPAPGRDRVAPRSGAAPATRTDASPVRSTAPAPLAGPARSGERFADRRPGLPAHRPGAGVRPAAGERELEPAPGTAGHLEVGPGALPEPEDRTRYAPGGVATASGRPGRSLPRRRPVGRGRRPARDGVPRGQRLQGDRLPGDRRGARVGCGGRACRRTDPAQHQALREAATHVVPR